KVYYFFSQMFFFFFQAEDGIRDFHVTGVQTCALPIFPVGVGFGIRDAETAGAIGKVSDGVIVGSVLVDTIARHQSDPDALNKALHDLLYPMREALDSLAH